MTDTRCPAILLFGAPGVGKGTQGKVLDAVPGFRHVASGDIFRALDPDSPEGREAETYSMRGKLVPDELTIRIFNAVLSQKIAGGEYQPDSEILLLDGIPRTVEQAQALDDTVDVLAVVAFDYADEDVMVKRIQLRAEQQNRPDDADEATIRHRFEVYRRETEPVLAHFPASRVHRINADASPLRVARDLLDALVRVVENR